MGDTKVSPKTVERGGPLVAEQSRPVGVSMPRGLVRRQAMVLVMDVSGSMENGKIDEANAAAIGLNRQLGLRENKGAFVTAYVTYGATARVLFQPKPSAQVDDRELTATVIGELTNITSGLEEALKLVELPPIESGNWLRPIVVVMTDGDHNHGPAPAAAATLLKAKADLIAVGFGFAANMTLLKSLATSPQHAFHCKDGTDLRRFFSDIGATMSRSIQSNQNAAALIGNGGVRRG